MAPHHIRRLHALLHGNAVAFSTWMAAEQKRLALLVAQRVRAAAGVLCGMCAGRSPRSEHGMSMGTC